MSQNLPYISRSFLLSLTSRSPSLTHTQSQLTTSQAHQPNQITQCPTAHTLQVESRCCIGLGRRPLPPNLPRQAKTMRVARILHARLGARMKPYRPLSLPALLEAQTLLLTRLAAQLLLPTQPDDQLPLRQPRHRQHLRTPSAALSWGH